MRIGGSFFSVCFRMCDGEAVPAAGAVLRGSLRSAGGCTGGVGSGGMKRETACRWGSSRLVCGVRPLPGASCVVAVGAGRGFSLGRNGGCAGGDLVRIARVVVAHEAEAVVEFEDVGCGRGDVEADDLAVG